MNQGYSLYNTKLDVNDVPLEKVTYEDGVLIIELDDKQENKWRIKTRPFLFRYFYENYFPVNIKTDLTDEFYKFKAESKTKYNIDNGVLRINNSKWVSEVKKNIIEEDGDEDDLKELDSCLHLRIKITNGFLEILCYQEVSIVEIK